MIRLIFRAATVVSALLVAAIVVAWIVAKSPAPTKLPVHPVDQRWTLSLRPAGLHATLSRPEQPTFFTLHIGGNMASFDDPSHYYKTTPQGTVILFMDGRSQTSKIDQGEKWGIRWQSGAASPGSDYKPPQVRDRKDEFWPALAMIPWHSVTIPYWHLLILTSILPALWILRRLMKLRRHKQGCCVRCGYDLRATPARCPECGHVPESLKSTPASKRSEDPDLSPLPTTPSTATSP